MHSTLVQAVGGCVRQAKAKIRKRTPAAMHRAVLLSWHVCNCPLLSQLTTVAACDRQSHCSKLDCSANYCFHIDTNTNPFLVPQKQLSESHTTPPNVPAVPPEVTAQLQSLREEARILQQERVQLHAELARLQQALKDFKDHDKSGGDVAAAMAAAVAAARQQWDTERQQMELRWDICAASRVPVLSPR